MGKHPYKVMWMDNLGIPVAKPSTKKHLTIQCTSFRHSRMFLSILCISVNSMIRILQNPPMMILT